MIIALDYDRTYTADKELWDLFIKAAVEKGHKVICLTMRSYPDEKIEIPFVDVTYTDRKAKKRYADENGIHVDIWIDDRPAWLFEDALPRGC